MMITIRGKQFSEETIVKALEKHCNFEQPYIFQLGDVVDNNVGGRRIIVRHKHGLFAVNLCGIIMAEGQSEFEISDYRKIGTLADFIEEN